MAYYGLEDRNFMMKTVTLILLFYHHHFPGAFGYDFSHNNETVSHAVSEVARKLLPSGVIGFCPTLVSSPPEVYQRVLKAIKKTQGGKDGSAVLG